MNRAKPGSAGGDAPLTQFVLPLDVELAPTIAMQRGDSRVSQCAWCGLLACHEHATGRTLGACPVCGHNAWWDQDFPPLRDDRAPCGCSTHIGPFARRAAAC